jgi:Tfp pilus assembly protein PilX
MSGNAYDRNIAFNAAEVGLRWAEFKLLKEEDDDLNIHVDDGYDDDDSGNVDTKIDDPVKPVDADSVRVGVIKLDEDCFKVNSEGVGRNSNTVVVLQSIVCRSNS